jgi:hypothetical protein
MLQMLDNAEQEGFLQASDKGLLLVNQVVTDLLDLMDNYAPST